MPADDIDRDTRETGKADRASSRGGQIDDATADERTAIIDPHHNGAAVTVIGNAHHGAEGQAAMSSCQARRLGPAALGGAPP